MTSAEHLLYNGKFYPSNALLISPDNRSFRYGDGFFETMKMINGTIILQGLHFERLFASLKLLQFDKPGYFTPAYLLQQMQALVKANHHDQLARIRLTIFRGDGGLYDIGNNEPNYTVQSWALAEKPAYHNEGIRIAVYREARKTADAFSAVKSNNYLPYAMAARWSKQQGLDDALVMNGYDRIAEATTSNIFIVKGDKVQTPALSEGCIGGVVRRYLIEQMQRHRIVYEETRITTAQVLEAAEVFLTNTGFYIRPVKQCGEKMYSNAVSQMIFTKIILPLIKNTAAG